MTVFPVLLHTRARTVKTENAERRGEQVSDLAWRAQAGLSEAVEPVACLLHDIGYVRGALRGDTTTIFVIDETGSTVSLPRGASDEALAPYHVDRQDVRFGAVR